MTRRIVSADIGGTHARFALATIDGEPGRQPRRAGHAQDRRPWQLPACLGGIRQAFGRAAAPCPCDQLRRAGRRRIAEAHQQSVGDPPGADPREARRHRLCGGERLRRGGLGRRRLRRQRLHPPMRTRRAASGRGHGHHPRPRHRARRRRAAARAEWRAGDRDRGRPRRFRAARCARRPHPRRAAQELPPGFGRAHPVGSRPDEPVRGARQPRRTAGDHSRRKGFVERGDGRERQPRRRSAGPLLPDARRGGRRPCAGARRGGGGDRRRASASASRTTSPARASATASSPRAGSSGGWTRSRSSSSPIRSRACSAPPRPLRGAFA